MHFEQRSRAEPHASNASSIPCYAGIILDDYYYPANVHLQRRRAHLGLELVHCKAKTCGCKGSCTSWVSHNK